MLSRNVIQDVEANDDEAQDSGNAVSWLGYRDSNPNYLIQSQASYH